MAATFSPGPPASASKPQKLFQGPYAFAPIRVAADGRFLLIRKSEEETSSRQINIVLGFDELLKRRFAASQ